MCAIVDANVVHEVFGANRPQAGKKFFDWIDRGSGILVVGGKLLEELDRGSPVFRKWRLAARRAGRVRIENRGEIKERMEELQREQTYSSDDPHVLALAQVSGARLLYSNDGDLQQDFGDRELISNPRGKVYTTSSGSGYDNTVFRPTHRRLLGRRDLCPVKH